MALGLGASLGKTGIVTPGIVTDSLVMKHLYPAGAVQPLSDGAAYFDGSDSEVDCGASNNLITGTNVTYACWFKAFDTDQGRLMNNQKGSGSTNLSLGVHNNDGSSGPGYITLVVWGGSSHAYVSYDGSIDDGNWHHIAATTTSSAQNLYLDGVLVRTESNTFSNAASSDIFTLGSLNKASEFAGGYMCNVGIWTGVLTQPQIKSIMWKQYADLTDGDKDAGTTGSSNLVSWYNLDVETNTSGESGTGGVKDHHGSNHGTLS